MRRSLQRAQNEERQASGLPSQAETLDLPDWTGQRRMASTLGMSEMLRYCEANLPHVRSFPGWRKRRNAGRCQEEFVLL